MPTVSLGLDIDGPCADYETELRRRAAAATGRPESDFPAQTDWSFVKSGWLDSHEDFMAIHTKGVADGMFATMPVVDGAKENLWRLSDAGIHIRVITHRLIVKGQHGRAAADTVTWLDNNEIPYRDLTFMGYKPMVGADIYLDDAPHNIAQLREAGCYAIVFETGYNLDVEGPRARNWDEAAELILARQEEILSGRVPARQP